MSRVPLAWKNLTHSPRKLLIAIAGIGFAVMLMFQQRGFNNALFDSTVALVKQLRCDLVVFHKSRFALSAETRFDRSILDVVGSCPGIEAVDPVYLETSVAMLRREGMKARPIRVIGLNPSRALFRDDWGTPVDMAPLTAPDTALLDDLSKPEYGFAKDDPQAVQQAELAGKHLQLVGLFRLGTDFATDGNLLMSDRNLAHYFPYRQRPDPLAVVDLGLIQCSTSAIEATKQKLQRDLAGRDVVVLTRQQMIDREIAFWAQSTPIGIIFFVGAIMGFVVGVVTCYQIIANDIGDHLSEFATLKAMGYSNWFFFQVVVTTSLYLSVFGFVPGLLLSLVLFQINSAFTGLVMVITLPRALLIFALTVVMCVCSAMLALRKLLSADPASLF